MKKTIIDLQRATGFPADGIFKQSIAGTSIESLYNEYAENVDMLLFSQYGHRVLYGALQYESALDVEKMDLIRTYIFSELVANQYKWERLIETTKSTYNPVENYNMVEEETTTDTKDEQTINDIELINGERISNSTNTNAVAPFNTDDMHNQSKQTENSTENEVTDTTHSDNKFLTDNVTVRKLTRSGNVGVTTTQQMLESERRIADFSIAKNLAKSVAGVIASNVYYNI